MKYGSEFWLILFREYISPKLFAVWRREEEDEGNTSVGRRKG
jgi:hypothetical protein